MPVTVEKLRHRQSNILRWLLALGHEIDDDEILAEATDEGLNRFLRRKHETVSIGGKEIIFDD